MKISSFKLKAIILYFCAKTNPIFLGKVKLMKLFYFLDFMHIKEYGIPVTYDHYVNLEHGPIPSSVKNLVDSVDDDVDNSILADTIMIKSPDNLRIHRVFPLREFNESDKKYLSDNELNILKKVCLRFQNSNTKSIEEASHEESAWKETKMFDSIPYTLAAKDKDCLVDEGTIKLLTNVTL